MLPKSLPAEGKPRRFGALHRAGVKIGCGPDPGTAEAGLGTLPQRLEAGRLRVRREAVRCQRQAADSHRSTDGERQGWRGLVCLLATLGEVRVSGGAQSITFTFVSRTPGESQGGGLSIVSAC